MRRKAQSDSWIEIGDIPAGDWRAVSTFDVDDLYRREAAGLTRSAAGRAGREDAADLVHEAFRRLIRAASSGQQLDRPGAYLACILQNLVRERHRRAHRRGDPMHVPFAEEAVAGSDPVPELEARDSIRRIDEALSVMKPVTRDVFLLHRLDGLGYEMIAQRMGMKVKRVEKHMSQALRLLRAAAGPR